MHAVSTMYIHCLYLYALVPPAGAEGPQGAHPKDVEGLRGTAPKGARNLGAQPAKVCCNGFDKPGKDVVVCRQQGLNR